MLPVQVMVDTAPMCSMHVCKRTENRRWKVAYLNHRNDMNSSRFLAICRYSQLWQSMGYNQVMSIRPPMTSIMFPTYGKKLAGRHAKQLLQMLQEQQKEDQPLLIHIFRYANPYTSCITQAHVFRCPAVDAYHMEVVKASALLLHAPAIRKATLAMA